MDELDKILNTVESREINAIVEEVLSEREIDLDKDIQEMLSYTHKVTANDIIPEEYQQKLMQIDITMTQCYWMIGDIVNELIHSIDRLRARELGRIVTQKDIFYAVGYICHRTARSIRYYYECAWYFPPEVRQKYDVPFNIYGVARWVDNWELVLKIAFENPMWSAERVRAEYYKAIEQPPPTRELKDSEVLLSQDTPTEYPLPQPGEIWKGDSEKRFRSTLLSKLEHTVDDLRDVINKIPLPKSIRERISDVLFEIQDISVEIEREL